MKVVAVYQGPGIWLRRNKGPIAALIGHNWECQIGCHNAA